MSLKQQTIEAARQHIHDWEESMGAMGFDEVPDARVSGFCKAYVCWESGKVCIDLDCHILSVNEMFLTHLAYTIKLLPRLEAKLCKKAKKQLGQITKLLEVL